MKNITDLEWLSLGYQCWICGTPIEEILGYCSVKCKQVYEHERREDILKSVPGEITIEACNYKGNGYHHLYTILLEIAEEPDNWVKQHRLIGVIRYCKSKQLPPGKLELAYHFLKQADSIHYNQKGCQIWDQEFLLNPDYELDVGILPHSILQLF